MVALTVLFGIEAGVLNELALVVFGTWQPVAPSSVPPVWHGRGLEVSLGLNLLLAFKPESKPAPSVAGTMDPARKFSSPSVDHPTLESGGSGSAFRSRIRGSER